MVQLSDIELFALLQVDDQKAFTVIVNRYSLILLRFANKRIANMEDSQDILQDVFVSLWKNRHNIQIENSIYPYLFQSIKYQIIDLLLKQQKTIARAELLKINQTRYSTDSTTNMEDEIIAKEMKNQIDLEVSQMPLTMRNVFTLSRNQAMSIREIAITLSISEQTVKNNISLALSRIKQTIK